MLPVPPIRLKGLFRSLYDFDFRSLVAPKLVRILYILLVVIHSLLAVFYFIAFVNMAGMDPMLNFIAVILVPAIYIVLIMLDRVFCEFLIVVLQIKDDLHAIRGHGDRSQDGLET